MPIWLSKEEGMANQVRNYYDNLAQLVKKHTKSLNCNKNLKNSQ